MVAPSVGQYLTDGTALIRIDAIHDEPDPTDSQSRRKVYLVEVDAGTGIEFKELGVRDVERLKAVRRG